MFRHSITPPPRKCQAKTYCLFVALILWLSVPASAQIDNCCGIDRECTVPTDWRDGYYAFHNGECTPQTQPEINNCCGVNRTCTTESQWIEGYIAFQNDQQCVSQAQTLSQDQGQGRGREVSSTQGTIYVNGEATLTTVTTYINESRRSTTFRLPVNGCYTSQC